MNKYNCVTGMRRSGTSAMMYALRQAGIPIAGFRYPGTIITDKNERQDVGMVKYDEKAKQENPTGFWEISMLATKTGLTNTYKDIGDTGDLVKVPLSVLPLSDRQLIDKTIVMVRNPRSSIVSRINVNEFKREETNKIKIGIMGIDYGIIKGLQWMGLYLIDYKIVIYEEFIKYPDRILRDVCEFLNRGDYKWGVKAVNPKLNRSKPEKFDRSIEDLIKESEEIYQLCVDRDIEKIFEHDTKAMKQIIQNIYYKTFKEQNKKVI